MLEKYPTFLFTNIKGYDFSKQNIYKYLTGI